MEIIGSCFWWNIFFYHWIGLSLTFFSNFSFSSLFSTGSVELQWKREDDNPPDSSSFLRSFFLSLSSSRKKTQHFDENHFARPIKFTEPWTIPPTSPSKWNTLDEYRPSTRAHLSLPLPFSSIFPSVNSVSMRIDQENREIEKGDQWNSVSANLCRWNVETDRSGKVENNRSSVKPRTRPHPSRVIPLKTFPSTRRRVVDGCSGEGCKSFCKIWISTTGLPLNAD